MVTTAGETPGAPVATDVRSRLNITLDATVRVLREHGRDGYARLALDQARMRTPLRVVVVGETKRGKSSLANTLMGTPGLSPVGMNETSATFVSLLPLPEDSDDEPHAAVLGPDGRRRTIALSEVGAYADLALLDPSEEPPLAVEVHVRPGPLGRIGVLDSPGIGGLGSSRARLTERRAADGGVLLYVVDAGSPMAATELEYLTQCAENVEHVVVAVTMIDKYPASWRTMVEHVHGQLATASVRLARVPVIGVSSPMADAAEAADESTRAALEEASGIRTLLAHLTAVARQQQLIAPLNALRTCRSGLENVAAQLDLMERAVDDPSELARIEAEAEQLAARQTDLRSVQGRWSLDLDRDLARLRSEVLRDARARLEALEVDARARIEKTPLGPGRKDYVRRLTVELVSEYALVRDALVDLLTSRFTGIVERMFGDSAPVIDLDAIVPTDAPGTAQVGQVHVPRDLLDPMVLTSVSIGASMGERLAGAFAGGPTALSILGPAGLVGAGAWAAFNIAFRSNRLERTKLTTEVRESLARQRTEFAEYVDAWIREVKPELAVAFRSHLETQVAGLNAALAAGRAAAKASEQQRAALVAAGESRRHQLRESLRAVDDALALGHL
ncbi:dynamin family protein [Terrabacter sp. GCM10028922]|uniref:dynamin family protein n=1 Tax=Terrabacter sp. GCM10028922 TaxID=3273428 RepID=UPI00360C1CAF